MTSRRPSSQSLKGTYCEFCRAKGHDISVCRKVQKFVQKQNKAPPPLVAAMCPSNLSVPRGPSFASSLTTANIEAAIQQVLSRTSTALFVTLGNHPWIFDTACCNHMASDDSQFSNKAPLAHPISIYTTDGTLMPISHKGIISIPSLSLSDTFHIPKLSLNLLFVGQLCELGVDILFTNHGVDVQDPRTSQVLGTSRKVGCVFEVHNLKIHSQVVSVATTTTTFSPNLWYARLGHTSLSCLQWLTSQGYLGSI